MEDRLFSDFLSTDRYQSAPDSPFVINPFPFEALDGSVKQSDCYDRPALPLNIGKCVPHPLNGLGDTWENACVLYEEMPGPCDSAKRVIWQADISDPSQWTETDEPYTAEFKNDALVLSNSLCGAKPFDHGVRITTACCDPQRTFLELDVQYLAKGSKLALLVYENEKPHCLLYEQYPVCAQNRKKYVFYLGDWMGRGARRLQVELRVFEGTAAVLRIGGLRLIQKAFGFRAAEAVAREWRPEVLRSQAHYPEGSSADVQDYLADANVIARHLSIKPVRRLWAVGYCDSVVRQEDGWVMTKGAQRLKLKAPQGVTVGFYSSILDFEPEAQARVPNENSRLWAIGFPCRPAEYTLCFCDGACMTTDALPRRELWEKWFARVPTVNFDKLKDIEAPELLRRAYATAWAQIIADLLPAQNGRTACVTTGKASLWAYGNAAYPYAASWETFYGLMLVGHLDAELAWDMYLAYLSTIEENGVLGGESLPSVKAQTGWYLHSLCPDAVRLREAQPHLERYLRWRIQHLRWIYLNRTPCEDEKDIDFVASALLDIDAYIHICYELQMTEAAHDWERQSEDLYKRFRAFFFRDGSLPVQLYYSDSGESAGGNPLIVTKALCLPMLKPEEREALFRRFCLCFDAQKPFGGFSGVKMENMFNTVRGLYAGGHIPEAYCMAKLSVKGIIQSGFFAEVYECAREVFPCGVRPSLFGCSLLICCIWLLGKR